MFTIIGILAVIAVIGFLILLVGQGLLEGAIKLILGIVILVVLIFAFRGCAMGEHSKKYDTEKKIPILHG